MNVAEPTVTVAVPTLNEEFHIDRCLFAITGQTYGNIVEVLVIDGGSTDGTVSRASRYPGVRLVRNRDRIQAAALNLAISEAKGDVLVRVDAHTAISPDYVEACVRSLQTTGAAMVGGGLSPAVVAGFGEGVAAAMRSPFGAGPARFHVGGPAGWVDTVYLGAFRVDLARRIGGYSLVGVNEDAEFALRMGAHGGVWYEPTIRSEYSPRTTVVGLAKQFYRYGRGRAVTIRRHPSSVKLRQLVAPVLIVGLVSPKRSKIAAGYAAVVAVSAVGSQRRCLRIAPATALAMVIMHLTWGVGFFVGLCT